MNRRVFLAQLSAAVGVVPVLSSTRLSAFQGAGVPAIPPAVMGLPAPPPLLFPLVPVGMKQASVDSARGELSEGCLAEMMHENIRGAD